MQKKISISLNKVNFSNFVEKLQDLTGIDDIIKIKIDKSNILLYSILGQEGAVSAMKSYCLKTKDYLENFEEEKIYDLVLTSSSKFVKNIKFFTSDKPLKMEISAKSLPDDDDVMQIRSINLTNGKLKISTIGGEFHKIRDINKKFIDTKLDLKNSNWRFKISNQDFNDIKKLSSINNEDKIIHINVLNNKVSFSELSKWEIEIDQVDSENQHLMFNKKYLSNIDNTIEEITFNIFDTFILIKEEDSNLMLSFEQDFS